MSDLPTLKSLLERVEGATGANLALEVDIARAFDTAPEGFSFIEEAGSWQRYIAARDDVQLWMPPAYTSSLDASLSLVNEMLPDEWPQFEVHARMIWDVHEWWHFWEITVPSREFQGLSKLAPLALLQCAIRALIQKETADHA